MHIYSNIQNSFKLNKTFVTFAKYNDGDIYTRMKTSNFIILAAAVTLSGLTSCDNVTIPDRPPLTPDISDVILNEIGGDDDFIELYNAADASVCLDGARVRRMRVKDGLDDEQTLWEGDGSSTIPAGGYLCLKYDGGKEGGLLLRKKISSSKNLNIWLEDASKTRISSFTRGAKGSGWNLMHMQKCTDDMQEAFSFSYVHGSWVYARPTPGTANDVKAGEIDGTLLQVVINEIDFESGRIELFNNSDREIDLLGFQLRWSRIKDSVADNKTIWECGKSFKIAPKGFCVLDPATSGNFNLDLTMSDYRQKNFHLRLRDVQNFDFTGEPYVYDDIKRGNKGSGWTLETLVTSISGSMVRVPDGTGEWYLSSSSSLGSSNGKSTIFGEVPELDAM